MNTAILEHVVKPKNSPKSLSKLTEQQLLGMPESDYMCDAQLAFFRKTILQTAIVRCPAWESRWHRSAFQATRSLPLGPESDRLLMLT